MIYFSLLQYPIKSLPPIFAEKPQKSHKFIRPYTNSFDPIKDTTHETSHYIDAAFVWTFTRLRIRAGFCHYQSNPTTHYCSSRSVGGCRKSSPATAETTAVNTEWSKAEDLVNGTISTAKLVKMKEVTSTLVNFLRDSCLGNGAYNPTWHGEYNSDIYSPGAQLKYGVTCHFAGQNADLSITANDIQPLLDQLVVTVSIL